MIDGMLQSQSRGFADHENLYIAGAYRRLRIICANNTPLKAHGDFQGHNTYAL